MVNSRYVAGYRSCWGRPQDASNRRPVLNFDARRQASCISFDRADGRERALKMGPRKRCHGQKCRFALYPLPPVTGGLPRVNSRCSAARAPDRHVLQSHSAPHLFTPQPRTTRRMSRPFRRCEARICASNRGRHSCRPCLLTPPCETAAV
jgi:hypothetical protein